MDSKVLYGNFGIFSPDGIFMFYTNTRKLTFFIKNDLIEQFAEKSFKLKFIPKGLGYNAPENRITGPGCDVARENICVVTGQTSDLNKHHIVPRFFRKYMPDRYKNNFQLVVLIDEKIHHNYTTIEHKFYDV
jgi:hypothetical protein